LSIKNNQEIQYLCSWISNHNHTNGLNSPNNESVKHRSTTTTQSEIYQHQLEFPIVK